jgi:hypothetical protein
MSLASASEDDSNNTHKIKGGIWHRKEFFKDAKIKQTYPKGDLAKYIYGGNGKASFEVEDPYTEWCNQKAMPYEKWYMDTKAKRVEWSSVPSEADLKLIYRRKMVYIRHPIDSSDGKEETAKANYLFTGMSEKIFKIKCTLIGKDHPAICSICPKDRKGAGLTIVDGQKKEINWTDTGDSNYLQVFEMKMLTIANDQKVESKSYQFDFSTWGNGSGVTTSWLDKGQYRVQTSPWVSSTPDFPKFTSGSFSHFASSPVEPSNRRHSVAWRFVASYARNGAEHLADVPGTVVLNIKMDMLGRGGNFAALIQSKRPSQLPAWVKYGGGIAVAGAGAALGTVTLPTWAVFIGIGGVGAGAEAVKIAITEFIPGALEPGVSDVAAAGQVLMVLKRMSGDSASTISKDPNLGKWPVGFSVELTGNERYKEGSAELRFGAGYGIHKSELQESLNSGSIIDSGIVGSVVQQAGIIARRHTDSSPQIRAAISMPGINVDYRLLDARYQHNASHGEAWDE